MTHTEPASAFYVSADSRYFLGLVALINSLRLVGHDEPIFVADCGFDDAERRRLAEHVTLVETDGVRTPYLAKTVAPLAHPVDVMVLIDADMIVTRPLVELIDRARSGKIIAFADAIAGRFDTRWPELLGLASLRRQSYVNAGLIVAEREVGRTLLEQVAAGAERVDVERTFIANGSSDDPFYYLDQDLVNAYLGTFPADQLELLEHRLAPFPPFANVGLVDEAALHCAYEDGVEPFVLHHIKQKPWLGATRWNLYTHLLGRVLLGQDVALRLGREEIPLRLHGGLAGWLDNRRCDAFATLVAMRARLAVGSRLRRRLGRV